jgi:endonuclease-3
MRVGGRPDRRTGGRADGAAEKRDRAKASKSSVVEKVIRKVLGKNTRGQSRKFASPPVHPSAPEIMSLLKRTYPDARCALNYRNPFELLCATILSAQCTDARVNMVTPLLFARYPTPFELARAHPGEVEEIIRSTGFFRNKTKSLIGMAQAIVAEHGGEVPRTMEELRKLPGVGRKTANVVLGNAYNTNEGVTVDTHVTRLSRLLGLTKEADPVKIQTELMRLFPQADWNLLSHLLIFHGRNVCIARRPRCSDCVLAQL